MTAKCIFAVGNFDTDEYWFNVLAEALKAYGDLKIIRETDELQEISAIDCISNLVILDSGSVNNPVSMIMKIKNLLPKAKIMVLSATPTWKESRQVRYAGAVEYCPKSLDKNEILDRVEILIGMP